MPNNEKVKVGIIGSQFEADIHAASIKAASEELEVVAVASPTAGNAAALAKKYGIPGVFTDYREMLKQRDIEMITIAAPNHLHAQMTDDCAQAGKHVVCEKPLAMTVEEGEKMIHVTRQAGVLLLYAEELFFTPKYLKAKEMANDGAFGKIHMVKQSEKHFGPHAPWFWDVDRCGGGALMDLGCHGLLSATGSWGVPRSSLCTVTWERMFTPTKRRQRTKLIAFLSLKAARWAWSRTAGDVEAEWMTGSKCTAQTV